MELENAASTIEVTDSGIVIRWSDGDRSRFHALWLRDNCSTGGAKGSSLRTFSIIELNPELFVLDAEIDDDGDLAIEFSDGHESVFDLEWLREHSHEPHERLGKIRPVSHFRAGTVVPRQTAASDGSVDVVEVGDAIDEWGLVIVEGLSPMFELEHQVEMTEVAIDRSTDRVQFLVDGFAIAADLSDRDPDAFDVLNEVSVPVIDWHGTVSHQPVILLDHHRRVCRVRFDERALAPLDVDPGQVGDYYRALITFATEVNDPTRALQIRLTSGEALLFDPNRVLVP